MTPYPPHAGAASDALTATYVAVLPQLRRIAAGLGFGPADADDILQQVYVAARTGSPPTAGDELERWLYRVTVNACHQEYRRRGRFQRATLRLRTQGGLQDAAPASTQPVHAAEQAARVRDALLALESDAAVPLVLRYFCEWDATQIGELLGLPPSTVRARLRRARLELADVLQE